MGISKADYMICRSMAKKNYSASELETTLEHYSPELPTRKASHERDYCQRTVKAAFADREVQEHLSKERQRAQTLAQRRGHHRSR